MRRRDEGGSRRTWWREPGETGGSAHEPWAAVGTTGEAGAVTGLRERGGRVWRRCSADERERGSRRAQEGEGGRYAHAPGALGPRGALGKADRDTEWTGEAPWASATAPLPSTPRPIAQNTRKTAHDSPLGRQPVIPVRPGAVLVAPAARHSGGSIHRRIAPSSPDHRCAHTIFLSVRVCVCCRGSAWSSRARQAGTCPTASCLHGCPGWLEMPCLLRLDSPISGRKPQSWYCAQDVGCGAAPMRHAPAFRLPRRRCCPSPLAPPSSRRWLPRPLQRSRPVALQTKASVDSGPCHQSH